MKVIANAVPKSGTHALLKAIELLGVPQAKETFGEGVMLTHLEATETIPDEVKVVTVFRNPRNCLVSMCRFQGRPIAAGFLIGIIRAYMVRDKSMRAYFEAFLPWMEQSHCIRYESLCDSDETLRGVAAFLGVPYLDDAFPNLLGGTMSWTGKPSDWRAHWNDSIQRVWEEEGMDEIEKVLGYGTVNQG